SFDYQFFFNTYHCDNWGTATITLWVSPNQNGPWTTQDSRTSRLFIQGPFYLQGTFTETNIPQGNSWYYVSASVYPDVGIGTSGQTTPAPICAPPTSTATPTATKTSTPT